MRLENLKWPELKDLAGKVFVVPLGSLEQHAFHLPLSTDTTLVSEVAARLEAARPEQVVLTPTQWLGHSPHHRRFGCVSLDQRPYMELVEGICRSLVHIGARRIFLLNGHGGNDIPCKAALRDLKSEFEDRPDVYIVYAAYWNLAAGEFAEIRTSPEGGIGHAGEMETSAMLAAAPDRVDLNKAVESKVTDASGRVVDMFRATPYYLVHEFDEMSVSGGIGLPSHASQEKGAKFLDAAARAAIAFVDEFAGWSAPIKAHENQKH